MEVELLEMRDFLAAQRPFDQLRDEVLSSLTAKLSIRYVRREQDIPENESGEPVLNVIRTGAAEIRSGEGELLARLGEGDLLGYRVGHRDDARGVRGVAIEDCLLYQLPGAVVDTLCDEHRQLAYFFAPIGGERLRDAVRSLGESQNIQLNLMTTPLRSVLARDPICLPPTATIRETAERMSAERVSSMLIVEQGHLFGIVTDRDLRLRVIAQGLDYDRPVAEIMTGAPWTVDISVFAYEALLFMARHGVHHLPVLDGTKVAGVVTATDFFERHSTSAIYLAGDIHRQDTVEGLQAASARTPQLLLNLAAAGATADRVGHVITGVGDAFTIRLLELAEMKMGPPPVDYAWVAAGSQARNEQSVGSDQDNALILDDSYDPSAHEEYFRDFTRFVCDGLDACGYVHCPGEMMAMTEEWRLPLKAWKAKFARWIDEPEPKSLMLTCVFFDVRHIYGDDSLFQELRQFVLDKARGNSIFLAHMTSNALSHQPPLGFFRNFVLIRGGEHDQTFDLKHNGIIPIVDLARVYALASGVEAVNTRERLSASVSGGEVSRSGARDLIDALAFIADVRLKHQARQLRSGEAANNFVSPHYLSDFERSHLKDAFAVVRTMQRVLSQRFKA